MKALSGLLFVGLILFVSCRPSDVSRGDGRIVGGVSWSINAAPYQVLLRYSGVHICGGENLVII